MIDLKTLNEGFDVYTKRLTEDNNNNYYDLLDSIDAYKDSAKAIDLFEKAVTGEIEIDEYGHDVDWFTENFYSTVEWLLEADDSDFLSNYPEAIEEAEKEIAILDSYGYYKPRLHKWLEEAHQRYKNLQKRSSQQDQDAFDESLRENQNIRKKPRRKLTESKKDATLAERELYSFFEQWVKKYKPLLGMEILSDIYYGVQDYEWDFNESLSTDSKLTESISSLVQETLRHALIANLRGIIDDREFDDDGMDYDELYGITGRLENGTASDADWIEAIEQISRY